MNDGEGVNNRSYTEDIFISDFSLRTIKADYLVLRYFVTHTRTNQLLFL